MANGLQLSVVTPERLLLEEQVDDVQIPGLGGYLGILPGHAPLFSEMTIGALSYTQGKDTRSIAVAGGFVEVLGDAVRVLADVAETAGDIDVERAETAGKRAAELIEKGGEGIDFERALKAGKRAAARLEVASSKVRR